MTEIEIINRKTRERERECIPYKKWIEVLYGKNPFAWFFRYLICYFPFFSKWFGHLAKQKKSQKNILPFIEKHKIDTTEFLDSVESFQTFNDFFIRKLKPSARIIEDGNDQAILPADGRYLVFQDIDHEEGFLVKGKKFSLEKLLRSKNLAHKYAKGSMVIVRLAPVDYHRFHFPCNCVPEEARLIQGSLFSVNPIALRKNIEILSDNKRMVTHLKTMHFGTVLFIEIGATYVGSIHQTFESGKRYAKGDEKGYFSFGGSSIVLLFEPFRIQFDKDLVENSHQKIETLSQMGQSLGRALSP